jgi:hypothetical protein
MIEPSAKSLWRWPLVIIVLLIAVLWIGSRMFVKATKSFAPTITNTTLIHSSVTRLQQEAKFVVMTAQINVEVRRSSEKVAFYNLLDFGDTVATVRTRNNKAQYYVDLSHMADSDFQLNANAKSLVVMIPDPRVDEEIVEVQTDPSQIEIETEVGWGRLSARSGQRVKDEAVAALRQAVIDEARAAIYVKLARDNAKEKIAGLLSPLVSQMGVTNVVIDFKNKKRTD